MMQLRLGHADAALAAPADAHDGKPKAQPPPQQSARKKYGQQLQVNLAHEAEAQTGSRECRRSATDPRRDLPVVLPSGVGDWRLTDFTPDCTPTAAKDGKGSNRKSTMTPSGGCYDPLVWPAPPPLERGSRVEGLRLTSMRGLRANSVKGGLVTPEPQQRVAAAEQPQQPTLTAEEVALAIAAGVIPGRLSGAVAGLAGMLGSIGGHLEFCWGAATSPVVEVATPRSQEPRSPGTEEQRRLGRQQVSQLPPLQQLRPAPPARPAAPGSPRPQSQQPPGNARATAPHDGRRGSRRQGRATAARHTALLSPRTVAFDERIPSKDTAAAAGARGPGQQGMLPGLGTDEERPAPASPRPGAASEKSVAKSLAAAAREGQPERTTSKQPAPASPRREGELIDWEEIEVRYKICSVSTMTTEEWRHEYLRETFYKRMREAFWRFLAYRGARQKESLRNALLHLGFVCSSARAIAAVSGQLLRLHDIDFMSFTNVIKWYAELEHVDFKANFDTADLDTFGTIDVRDLDKLMRNIGVIVGRREVEAFLAMAFPAVLPRRLTFDKFCYLMAVYRTVEGFSDTAEVERTIKAFKGRDGTRTDVPVSELGAALLEFFGAQFGDLVKEVLGVPLSEDGESAAPNFGATPVAYREFLVWVRRIRELEKSRLWKLFNDTDTNHSGEIDREELGQLMQGYGYTPLNEVVTEFLAEASGNPEARQLDFDSFLACLQAVQARDGFTKREQKNLLAAFELFQQESRDEGRLDGFLFLRLVRWLGYNPKVEALAHFFKEAGIPAAPSFDYKSFVRTMRMYREASLGQIRQLCVARGATEEGGERDGLIASLEAVGIVDFPVMEEELRSAIGRKAINLDALAGAIDRLRQEHALQRQRLAGFSKAEAATVFAACTSCVGADNRGIRVQEHLPWLLSQLGAPMHSKEQRAAVLETRAAAWRAAEAAGWSGADLGDPDSVFMTLHALVHMVRLVADLGERVQAERELHAIAQTGFSPTEVAEFREVFKAHADCRSAPKAPELLRRNLRLSSYVRKRTAVFIETAEDVDALAAAGEEEAILRPYFEVWKISKDALWNLFSTTAMRGNVKEVYAFSAKVDDAVNASANVGVGQEGADFSEFLRLMKWVLDSNFADIHGKAQGQHPAYKNASFH